MPQSLAQLYTHLVFSSKERVAYFSDADIRERVHAYLVGVCRNQGSPSLETGGAEDHVHILCRLSKTLAVSALMAELKRDSSKWIKTQGSGLGSFYWQEGYGAFSVSSSHVERVRAYIRNQMKHHQKKSYKDEFRELCKMYGVEMDERYVWD